MTRREQHEKMADRVLDGAGNGVPDTGDRVKSGGRNNHGALQKLWECGDT